MKIPEVVGNKVKLCGYSIQFTQCVPDNARAHVIVVHGMGEHSGRYAFLDAFFIESNMAITRFDLPGHGLSSGLRGDVSKYSDFFACIDYFVDSLQAPTILLCHSMGGNIGLSYLLEKKNPKIVCASIGSPWIQLNFKPSFFKAMLAAVANKIAPKLLQKTDLDTNYISRLPDQVERYRNDELIHSYISPRLFTYVQSRGLMFKKRMAQLQTPVFLYHGTEDSITSYEASKECAAQSNWIQFKTFENCYHEVHNEPERDELLSDLLAFYKQHI